MFFKFAFFFFPWPVFHNFKCRHNGIRYHFSEITLTHFALPSYEQAFCLQPAFSCRVPRLRGKQRLSRSSWAHPLRLSTSSLEEVLFVCTPRLTRLCFFFIFQWGFLCLPSLFFVTCFPSEWSSIFPLHASAVTILSPSMPFIFFR